MMLSFDPPPPVTLAVTGSDERFPVHHVYCVGRNYADHAVEMGGDPDREPPFFFTKSADAIVENGGELVYPDASTAVHHEVELVVALGQGGRRIDPDDAMKHVYGYGVGIDMTRRDLQAKAKQQGRPWAAAKSFPCAAPCSPITRISETGDVTDAPITLDVSGERRQEGNVNQMIWKVPEIVARLSALFALRAGDLVFTGTPAGVGPVQVGDVLTARVVGVADLSVRVVGNEGPQSPGPV